MPNPSANIVLVLDCSGSMQQYNYFQPAQTDVATFVNIMHPNDNVGMVGFSDNAWIFFPASGSSSLVSITGLPTQNQAVQAVLGQSTHNMTNMAAAVATAHAQMGGASAPRAIVFLSDGCYNTGGNPLDNLPTDVPIYTIALGPNSDINTLQQMAYRTVGQGLGYYYAPTAWDLSDMYNSIVQASGVAATTLNQKAGMANYSLQPMTALIGSGQSEARFAVNWTNPGASYVSGTPTGNQINVALRDPNNNPVTPTTTASGMGFVVFSVANPLAGNWQLGLWTAQAGGLGATLDTVAGAYEPGSQTQLRLSFEDGGALGRPAPYAATVTYRGEPVSDVQIHAVGEAPLVSFEQAISAHADALHRIDTPEAAGTEREPFAKLAALHRQLLPGRNILPRETYPLETLERLPGVHAGELTHTGVAGPHTVRVVATGRTPDGNAFRRVACLSINVG